MLKKDFFFFFLTTPGDTMDRRVLRTDRTYLESVKRGDDPMPGVHRGEKTTQCPEITEEKGRPNARRSQRRKNDPMSGDQRGERTTQCPEITEEKGRFF